MCFDRKNVIEFTIKTSKFKVGDRIRITKYKNIFSKGNTKKWSEETFNIISVLGTNYWTYKIQDLNGEKNMDLVLLSLEKYLSKEICMIFQPMKCY